MYILIMCIGLKRHTFKQPAKPIEPPTPRTSILGLDRLAREKRASTVLNDGDRKRQRLDSNEPMFKGESNLSFVFTIYSAVSAVPALPASHGKNIRQRGEETPSHPGGLSEVGRRRLEEHRRNRDKQRGLFQ